MPPLKPWQIMPVPLPTLPSATGPELAPSRAAHTSPAETWAPLMSLSSPSHVSATTGSDHQSEPDRYDRSTCTRASRTTPTECVFVRAIAEVSSPDSSIQWLPVISPLPLSRPMPANTGLSASGSGRGTTTVTPVRTGPSPTTSGPSPAMRVTWPTATPGTSTMAFSGPVRPDAANNPMSRARISVLEWSCHVTGSTRLSATGTPANRRAKCVTPGRTLTSGLPAGVLLSASPTGCRPGARQGGPTSARECNRSELAPLHCRPARSRRARRRLRFGR